MLKANHLMLDIETLSTEPDAVVLSIAAVVVPPMGQPFPAKAEYPLQKQVQLDMGRKVSASTLSWWSVQSDEARALAMAPDDQGLHPLAALEEISSLWEFFSCQYVWGLPSTFDVSTIEDLATSFGVEMPWSHRQVRCLRTAGALAPCAPRPKPELAHSALSDALAQSEWLRNILEEVLSDD